MRAQVPFLHDGHKALIRYVLEKNDEVQIFIGQAKVRGISNPLPVASVIHAINYAFPGIKNINIIDDEKSDGVWSYNLDNMLNQIYLSCYDVVLYGSRDSFISNYHGKYRCEYVQVAINHPSATKIRHAIGTFIKDSGDWRQGVIYASQSQYPTSYQCVDIAVIKDSTCVLLIKKHGEKNYRFPGGFVDPADKSLEHTANRELGEECGAFEHGLLYYLGSYRINDWRYAKEPHKVMTAFFQTDYSYGQIKAGDDAASADWLSIENITAEQVEPEHRELLTILKSQYEKELNTTN